MQGKLETRVGIFVLAALGVFIYMGFEIGAFRFDRARYAEYNMLFTDITGLSRKADVKIAGVKVGWVEGVKLLSDGTQKAEAHVMILKKYALHSDAYAVVRQDGLLGPKYIEVVPGDPLLRTLSSGATLGKPSEQPVSIDELLVEFKDIANNVKDVTKSFKTAVGGVQGQEMMTDFFDNLHAMTRKLSHASEIIERTLSRNEENIDQLLEIGTNFRHLSEQLEQSVLPTIQEGVEKISNSFDRDFDRIATKLESTADAIEQASVQARDGMRNVSSVAEKIDEGKGLIGKLVNEDDTYQDLKCAVEGLKNYLTKIDRMQIVFDSHFESMHRPAENYNHEDNKGYLDVRIHPNEDHFYVVQLASSEKGYVKRKKVDKEYCTNNGEEIDPTSLDINDNSRLQHIFVKKKQTYKRNTLKLGLQFGKIFGDIAVRFGLFEGSAGAGVDIDIPFRTDNLRWVTTLEAFDLSGWNRKHDRRPHLKWLNRMYFLRNIYFVFGADDFVSKRNQNAFFGAGLRFGDDDVKYLAGAFAGAAS